MNSTFTLLLEVVEDLCMWRMNKAVSLGCMELRKMCVRGPHREAQWWAKGFLSDSLLTVGNVSGVAWAQRADLG